MKVVGILSGLLVVAAPVLVRAHGGEDHGASKPEPAGSASVSSSSGEGDDYEVLLRASDLRPGVAASITVFVSDLVTNEPIAADEVQVEFGDDVPGVTLEPAGEGTYLGHAILPAGSHAPVVTVTSGDTTDLVPLTTLEVAPIASDHPGTGSELPLSLVLLGAAFLLVGGIVVIRGRRPRVTPAVTAAVFALLAADARAHGGEVHAGEGAPPAATAGPGIPFPKESQFLLDVRTAVVGLTPLETRSLAPGRVLPRLNGSAEIRAPFAGRLDASTRLPMPGERVRKGQVLGIFEQNVGGTEQLSLAAERVRLQAELAQAEADVAQVRATVSRLEKLAGVVAEKEVVAARSELTKATQRESGARRGLSLLGSRRSGRGFVRQRFVAPISGVVAEVAVTLGQQVDAQGLLFTVVDPSVVWVEASIFPADLERAAGARSATVRVDAFPDRTFIGRVVSLGSTVDSHTQAVRALFEVANPEALLRPGMFADVALGSGKVREALAVPDDAVVESEGRRFVYVKKGPESFESREVVLGARDGAVWEVRKGLAPGERVVVRGTYQLRSAKGGL